jgi:hypothetical protein
LALMSLLLIWRTAESNRVDHLFIGS